MKSKKTIKKLICLLILATYSLSAFLNTAYAENIVFPYYNESLESNAALVMDANSSVILYDKNSNERLYPASLTKIMTAIVVLDYVGDGYDNMVNFSYNAVTQDIDKTSVTISATAGDQLSVKDCLYSMLLASANDAANALAEYVAGSIKDFALLMNERAASIGCSDTHFINPSGLHNDNQYTTASDMAKIIQHAMTYPMFMQISSSVSYRHAPIRRFKDPENSNNLILNTNSIMVPGSGYYYNGITAGKTGHTTLAGYNLAASARKNDMHLICIVLGAKNDKMRYIEAKSLFDFYFNNYHSLLIKDIDPRFNDDLSSIAIDDVNLVETLNITCDDTSHITLPNGVEYDKVTSKISYQVEDIYDKYAIGTVYYYLDNVIVGKCNIEGKNMESSGTIFTSILDLTAQQDSDETAYSSQVKNQTERNSLIYRNEKGNLVVSETLLYLISILLIIILVISLIFFIYTKILTNSNIPIQKIFFRFRRRFRR
ncbi:MAG: D-alanyl-D-alanine carboxypeptidase [Lachnospiraceae bacterium]|nr:D-alanyl-D-alanine carboxypeptidase [Lachnospiraceae bacterium]